MEQQRLAAQLEMDALAGKLQEQTNLYNNSVRQNDEIRGQLGALQGGKDIAERQSATVVSEKDAVERNLAQLQQQLDGAQGQVKDQIGALQEKDHERQMLTAQQAQLHSELQQEKDQAHKLNSELSMMSNKCQQLTGELQDTQNKLQNEQHTSRQVCSPFLSLFLSISLFDRCESARRLCLCLSSA